MDKQKEYDEEGRVIRENRSQLKRERLVVREFAESLLKLPVHQYEKLQLNQKTLDALIEGKRLSGNAYQRHLTYLTRLLMDQDIEKVKQIYINIDHPSLNQNPKKKLIADFLEKIINQDKNALSDVLIDFPSIDLQHIRQLTREFNKQIKIEQKLSPEELLQKPKDQLGTEKYKKKITDYLMSQKIKE